MVREEDNLLKRKKVGIKVDDKLPDYDKDPVFVKQRQDAIQILKETPLPDFLLKKANTSVD